MCDCHEHVGKATSIPASRVYSPEQRNAGTVVEIHCLTLPLCSPVSIARLIPFSVHRKEGCTSTDKQFPKRPDCTVRSGFVHWSHTKKAKSKRLRTLPTSGTEYPFLNSQLAFSACTSCLSCFGREEAVQCQWAS